MNHFSIYLLPLISVLCITNTYGHSHLADPLPVRELHCRVGAQQGRDCPGPCPRDDRYGRPNGITIDNPAETWGRGQRINVRWHRDNRKLTQNRNT